ncbi:MAG: outer membrane beta-barrel protein [Candidatus Omnitrophota bacterium]
MKKVIPFIIAFAMIGLMAMPAVAQQGSRTNDMDDVSDISNRWGIGYSYGWAEEDTDDLGLDQQHSVNYVKGLTRNSAFQLEAGWATDDDYEADLYSLFADYQLRAPMERLAPYVFGGIGLHNTDAKEIFDITDNHAFRAGVGVEYFMTDQAALNAEGIYNFEGGGDSVEYSQIRAGIRFYY